MCRHVRERDVLLTVLEFTRKSRKGECWLRGRSEEKAAPEMAGQPCWIGLVTLTRRLGARLQGWGHDEEETGDVSIGLERPHARDCIGAWIGIRSPSPRTKGRASRQTQQWRRRHTKRLGDCSSRSRCTAELNQGPTKEYPDGNTEDTRRE